MSTAQIPQPIIPALRKIYALLASYAYTFIRSCVGLIIAQQHHGRRYPAVRLWQLRASLSSHQRSETFDYRISAARSQSSLTLCDGFSGLGDLP
jgi:hypothetical protein